MDKNHKSEKQVSTGEEINQENQESSQSSEISQEKSYSCNSSETSKRKPSSSREAAADDYGLRQHERHILFHFFTLFSISFFIGVLFIHLSIWINSNYISSYMAPPSDKSESANENLAFMEKLNMPDRRSDEIIIENFNQIPVTISAFAKNVTVSRFEVA